MGLDVPHVLLDLASMRNQVIISSTILSSAPIALLPPFLTSPLHPGPQSVPSYLSLSTIALTRTISLSLSNGNDEG